MRDKRASAQNGPPLGIRTIQALWTGSVSLKRRSHLHKLSAFLITYLTYATYHMTRKPISVAKNALFIPEACKENHSLALGVNRSEGNTSTLNCGWAPFDNPTYATELLGALDTSFLISYSLGLYFCGHLAERSNLRWFLTFGMLSTGAATAAFGLGYFWCVHHLAYYLAVQVVSGLAQSTGFPAVVPIMANWFGKSRRGVLMGVWNTCISVGNILGALLASIWVNDSWGMCFLVPAAGMTGAAALVWLFAVPGPRDVLGSTRSSEATDPENNSLKGEYDNSDYAQEGEQNDNDSNKKTSQLPAQAISFYRALCIPGVVEYSLCLFFVKLVGYTFLFWLPLYIKHTTNLEADAAARLSTFFDIGSLLGGICIGLASDVTRLSGSVCVVSLLCSIPILFVYDMLRSQDLLTNELLLAFGGACVNGPYTLIVTAISMELGTHPSLHGNSKALSTVTAIIDATGSAGAAVGPALTSLVARKGWSSVFYMLMTCNGLALLCLFRVAYREMMRKCGRSNAHHVGRPQRQY